jgi:hypothetical protein
VYVDGGRRSGGHIGSKSHEPPVTSSSEQVTGYLLLKMGHVIFGFISLATRLMSCDGSYSTVGNLDSDFGWSQSKDPNAWIVG